MNQRFLDEDGVQQLWTRVKEKDAETLAAAKNDAAAKDTALQSTLLAKINTNASDVVTLKSYFSEGKANQAIADGSGNNISSTYAKQSEFSALKKTVDNFFSDSAEVNNTIDTLKEIQNYISNHGNDVGDMLSAIDAVEEDVAKNTTDIDKLETQVSNIQTNVTNISTVANSKSKTHIFDSITQFAAAMPLADINAYKVGDHIIVNDTTAVLVYWVEEVLTAKTGIYNSYYNLIRLETVDNASKLNGQSASYYLNYNNLTNLPTIPPAVTVDSALSTSSTNAIQNKVVATALNNKVHTVYVGTTAYTPSNGVVTLPSYTTYGIATASNPGLVKVGFTTTDKNYAVQLSTNNQLYVNVPWENTTYGAASALSDGLMTKAQYTKLQNIEAGATADSAISSETLRRILV